MSDEKLKPTNNNDKTIPNANNNNNNNDSEDDNRANRTQTNETNQKDSNNQNEISKQEAENEDTAWETAQEELPRNDSKSVESVQIPTINAVDGQEKKQPLSALYVLHTEHGNVYVNRRCHLPRSEGVNVRARRKLIVASILCLFFVLCEIIGGLISNSLAVGADAAHTLTDFAGFMISLFAIWLAGRKSTDRLSFGWYRAEVIGALVSVMTIWLATAVLVWLAIERCIKQDFEIKAIPMMVISIFGIVTNIILGIYLAYGESKVTMNCELGEDCLDVNHNHKPAHRRHKHCFGVFNKLKQKLKKCFKIKNRKRNPKIGQPQNMNVKAAYLHVLGDGLQSVGVLIAAIIIYLKPKWVLADTICTFLFSAIILYTTFNILKDIIVVLMEGTPTYIDYNAVQTIFESIPGVKSVHHLRIWALTLEKVALAVHLIIESDKDPHEILVRAEYTIHKYYNLFETTIQIETEGHEKPNLIN